MRNNKKRRLLSENSLTNVSPLNDINNQIQSPILLEIFDEDDDDDEDHGDKDRYFVRPPPLLVLSQSIRRKHPEQLKETRLNNRFSSIKDLPNSPANYSFVFYGFPPAFVFEFHHIVR